MDPFTTAGLGILAMAVSFGVMCVGVIGIVIAASWIERWSIMRHRARFDSQRLLGRLTRGRAA